MPPVADGSSESGVGASFVQRTKPSADGAPEATPRLKGLARQTGAFIPLAMAGAARSEAPALNPASTVRRDGWNSRFMHSCKSQSHDGCVSHSIRQERSATATKKTRIAKDAVRVGRC